MSEITQLGKELRKLRIDLSENMANMAKKIGYSTSMLSAIEINQRTVPDDFVKKLVSAYPSLEINRGKFEKLVVLQNGAVRLAVDESHADVFAALARRLENPNDKESFFEDLRNLLNKQIQAGGAK